MRILVNCLATSKGGALSILTNFYNHIKNSKEEKENEWIFLLNDKYIEETDNIKVIIVNKGKQSPLRRLYFDFIKGKTYISKYNPDVVFSLQNTISFGLKIPQVLYMHQAIPFQQEKNFSFFKKDERTFALYQHVIGRVIISSIKRANHTIVQTDWIKREVVSKCGIDLSSISVVLPNIEKLPEIKKIKRNEKSYTNFFYPAAKSIYKNHGCIYEATRILQNEGITDYNIDLTIKKESDTQNINFLNEISREKVNEKYQYSTLIFPSYIETLGLPLLEAKQYSSIILASDMPFSKEVLKNYENAYYFNPHKPAQLAKLMSKVISGEITRKETFENKDILETDSWKDVCEIIKDEGRTRITNNT
ncbi:glycosyltransferase [Planococcus versutus]|uniref:Glycosyl transferase family 1 domain-containing protein n=1 Tax=Planococcus versutus TaxID=1302659 RepID=A0A1B1S2Y1_9BACL|nr:glycosyltransferase [Planococcus versutus]ANU27546.1 hypothetical protein I858_011160 [Planococcus versutus]